MKFYLNDNTLPTIPVPHDCVVKNISVVDDFLVLEFEDNIYERDSIRYLCPEARSLTVKIHLIDLLDVYLEKIRKFPAFKKIYNQIDIIRLIKLAKDNSIEYLYHYVGFQRLIINLWCKTNIILNLTADYVEFQWIY